MACQKASLTSEGSFKQFGAKFWALALNRIIWYVKSEALSALWMNRVCQITRISPRHTISVEYISMDLAYWPFKVTQNIFSHFYLVVGQGLLEHCNLFLFDRMGQNLKTSSLVTCSACPWWVQKACICQQSSSNLAVKIYLCYVSWLTMCKLFTVLTGVI